MSAHQTYRVTGIAGHPLEHDPARSSWTVFLRPASGTGPPCTLYVEAAQQPYQPDTVVELCPEWVTLTPGPASA